jgi:ketosteroid isomerase-like protein
MRSAHLRQHLLLWLAAAAVFGAPLAWAQNAKGEQELREAVKKFMAGYASNTTEGYFQHYAKDVTFWFPNGNRLTRQAYYQMWDEVLRSGDNNVKSAVAEDVRVHSAPSGESGVASFIWKVERAKGEPYTLWTSATYFKRNGKWEIIHMHFTRAAPADGGSGQAQVVGGDGGANQPPPAARPAPVPSDFGPAKEVAEVKAVDDIVTQTYGSSDPPGSRYFGLYSDNLTWWGPRGRMTKETYKEAYLKSKSWTEGESAKTSDMRIQVAPKRDLAVASYLLTLTRNDPSATRTFQQSRTLIKRNGKWEIVHLHYQRVPPQRPATHEVIIP